MAKEALTKSILSESFLKQLLICLSSREINFGLTTMRKADVLYLSFQRPQKATDSEMRDDGVLLRYKRDKLVGITILEASKR